MRASKPVVDAAVLAAAAERRFQHMGRLTEERRRHVVDRRTEVRVIVVYTIGLDPTSAYGTVNQELLRRIANDKLSAVYQSTYTAGQFYYVPTAGQLSQAFAAIASDILRLAK